MIKRASLYIEFEGRRIKRGLFIESEEFQRLRGPTFYDTCLNLVHLFLYMGTIYKICLVITPENEFPKFSPSTIVSEFCDQFWYQR